MLSEAFANLALTVTYAGARHEVRIKPGDLVRFEEHFGRALFDLDADGEVTAGKFGVTELSFLAFCALRRAGIVDDFDVFLDDLDDIDVGGEGGAPKAP